MLSSYNISIIEPIIIQWSGTSRDAIVRLVSHIEIKKSIKHLFFYIEKKKNIMSGLPVSSNYMRYVDGHICNFGGERLPCPLLGMESGAFEPFPKTVGLKRLLNVEEIFPQYYSPFIVTCGGVSRK